MATFAKLTVCTLVLMASSLPLNAATKLSSTDTRFMTEAAQGGIGEVMLGNLAQKQATNSEVKQFGARMVKDHTNVNNQLMTLAKNKNVTLPKDTDAEHKARERDLSKMKGTSFDRAYMEFMVTDHQKDVNLFRRASTESKDADVKRFASDTLPTLQEHLQLAEDIVKRGVSAKAKTKASPKPRR